MEPNSLQEFNNELVFSVECGNTKRVNELLKIKGINVNHEGGYAIIEASKNGHIEIVKLLLNKGAIVFADAFIRAVECGHIEIVKLLMEKIIDINIGHGAALRAAIKSGRFDTVKFLIENGANVDAGFDISLEHVFAFYYVYDCEARKKVRESFGKEINISLFNASPISLAVELGRAGIVEILLKNGANIKYCSDFSLAVAVKKGYVKTVKLIQDEFLKKTKASEESFKKTRR